MPREGGFSTRLLVRPVHGRRHDTRQERCVERWRIQSRVVRCGCCRWRARRAAPATQPLRAAGTRPPSSPGAPRYRPTHATFLYPRPSNAHPLPPRPCRFPLPLPPRHIMYPEPRHVPSRLAPTTHRKTTSALLVMYRVDYFYPVFY